MFCHLERKPLGCAEWEVDGFHVWLHVGSRTRRRTEAALRHKHLRVTYRRESQDSDFRRASGFSPYPAPREEVAVSQASRLPTFFCCPVCWLVFAVSQGPKEGRKGLKPQWLIDISYMGDQRTVWWDWKHKSKSSNKYLAKHYTNVNFYCCSVIWCEKKIIEKIERERLVTGFFFLLS